MSKVIAFGSIDKLEKDILGLINEFELKYDVTVQNIGLSHRIIRRVDVDESAFYYLAKTGNVLVTFTGDSVHAEDGSRFEEPNV